MNKIGAIISVIVMSLAMSFTSLAGEWKQESDGRWKYQDDNGSCITSSTTDWFSDPETGRLYHFDSQGYMQTGLIEIDGKNYYCDTNGAKTINYITPEGYLVDLNGEVTNNLPGATMLYGWHSGDYSVGLIIMNKSDESFTVENYCTITTNNMSRTLHMVEIDTLSFVDKGIVYGGIQDSSNATIFTFVPSDYGEISVNDSSNVEFYFTYNGNQYSYWSLQDYPMICNLQ